MSLSSDELISAVYLHRPLWDQRDKEHHNRFILDKLWDQVASELQSTRKDVRSKWKNLRDKFRAELRKIPKSRSGDGVGDCANEDPDNPDGTQPSVKTNEETPISSWQFFESLRFLTDQFTARQGYGNLESTDPAVLDPNDERAISFDECVSPDRVTLAPSPSPSSISSSKSSQKRKRYAQKEDIGKKLILLEEAKLQLMREDIHEQPNKHMAFFSSLLPHIEKLPDDKQMLLQMEIQQVVYRHVYGNTMTNNHFSRYYNQPINPTNSSFATLPVVTDPIQNMVSYPASGLVVSENANSIPTTLVNNPL